VSEEDVRFAVYLVMVEDTEECDMSLAEEVDSLDRLAGDMTYKQAEDYMSDIKHDGQTP
jgi:hypothetical protein